jgi:hypothetical protein
MSFLTKILSPKKLLIFAIFYSIFYIYGLWERRPDVDDAWLGEHAYWQAKDGYVHSELTRGIDSEGVLLLIHHKLFTLQGALFIKLFGFSLYSLKSISLFYFIIFICLFYFYTVKYKQLLKFQHFVFALILFLVFPSTYNYSFVYRPEIMMMTVGFVGYILLEKYLESGFNKKGQIFLVGLLFGLTMAAHLNGLIFVLSGFVILIWNKKRSGLLAFSLGSIVGFSPYFYDMTRWMDFATWWSQISGNPALDSLSDIPLWLKPIANLINEQIHFFHDLEIISFSIFLIYSVLIGFGFLKRNNNILIKFTFLVALFTGFIAPHKLKQYLLLNIPYFILLITLVFKNIENIKPEFGKRFYNLSKSLIQNVFVSLFLIFLLVSTYSNIRLATVKFKQEDNAEITKKYTNENTSKLNIVAPMTFIFNEIENFHRIQGEECYAELQKGDTSIRGRGFLNMAATFNAKLIMVSPYYMPKLGVDKYKMGDTVAQYRVIDKSPQLIVFKRLN